MKAKVGLIIHGVVKAGLRNKNYVNYFEICSSMDDVTDMNNLKYLFGMNYANMSDNCRA